MREQFELIAQNMRAVGMRRILVMAALLATLTTAIGFAGIYLNRPAYETLYVGLDRDDVNRVGIALSEAGFSFDVDSTGTSVLVETGSASSARMILAEKGLPASSGAGYELFDNLGSLGLTSFMQEVTRLRALEGEIARSVQAINGVKSARVHIVMPDRTAFSDRDRKPTASILIKADNDELTAKAYAIRHLVAAAVPSLSSEDVTIMDSAGNLLATGQDQFSNALSGSLEIQRTVETGLEQKIITALGPQFGANNVRISVQAQIDTDRRRVEETTFDPASRVERSIQVVKAEDSSTQKAEAQNVSVEQNLPQASPDKASGPISDEKSQKREETTNYEISSKKVDTQRNGYRIERLAVSIVLNKTKIAKLLGPKAKPADIEARLTEVRKIASTSVGLDLPRGDKLNVSALEFIDEMTDSAFAPSLVEKLSRHIGTAINAFAFIVVAALVLFIGIKPAIRALSVQVVDANRSFQLESSNTERPKIANATSGAQNQSVVEPNEDVTQSRLAIERLRAIADADPDRVATALRQWLVDEAA